MNQDKIIIIIVAVVASMLNDFGSYLRAKDLNPGVVFKWQLSLCSALSGALVGLAGGVFTSE